MLMVMGSATAIAGEAPTRRRRVYQVNWKFSIGQAVRSHEMDAIILSRERSAFGTELYHLWIATNASGRPYRVINKKMLIPKN